MDGRKKCGTCMIKLLREHYVAISWQFFIIFIQKQNLKSKKWIFDGQNKISLVELFCFQANSVHEVHIMTVCYNKLWKLLIDKNMKKKDLRLATGMSTTALAKLGKNEHISTEILAKICKALDCDFCDIIELVKEEHDD